MTGPENQQEQVVDSAPEAEATPVVEVDQARIDKLVKYHIWTSAGMGLVPLPVVDFVGVTAIQLNLLRKLSSAYGVPFSKNLVKNIVGALLGGLAPTGLAVPVMRGVKSIPVMGTVLGVLTMPVFASASTYALAKVFIQHFASGGTFLSFNPEKVKTYYQEKFKEGLHVAPKAEATA